MLEANEKIANLYPLTPNIQLNYRDLTQIETGTQENIGYYVFQAQSILYKTLLSFMTTRFVML